MTKFDEEVLELAMDRVKALELLENPEYCCKLTMEGFERLLIRAGYSFKEAHKAAMEHGWNRLGIGKSAL